MVSVRSFVFVFVCFEAEMICAFHQSSKTDEWIERFKEESGLTATTNGSELND